MPDTRAELRLHDGNEDERLADLVGRHFLQGEPFPEGRAGLRRFGHEAAPPAPLGRAWALEPGEAWLAHRLGTVRRDLGPAGDFATAGAAELLVTSAGVRLLLAGGGPGAPRLLAPRGGSHAPASRLDAFRVPFARLLEVGLGDLLFLRAPGPGSVALAVPYPRATGALIAGLRVLDGQRAIGAGDRRGLQRLGDGRDRPGDGPDRPGDGRDRPGEGLERSGE